MKEHNDKAEKPVKGNSIMKLPENIIIDSQKEEWKKWQNDNWRGPGPWVVIEGGKIKVSKFNKIEPQK